MDTKDCDTFILNITPENYTTAMWRHDGTALHASGKVSEDERLRRDISRYINMLRQGGADLRPDDIIRLGSSLYEALFPAEIGALFERALDAVTLDRRRDLWLRVVIDVDPRSIVFLWPLELLYCERKKYWLGAESQIALSRRTFGWEMKLERKPPPLPVLVVMSDPKDPDLGGKTTTEVLKKMAGLAGTGSSKKMDIKLLGVVEGYEEIAGIDYLEKPATYENLVNLERSMDWRPRVLHFIGHGKCEQSTKEGSIGLVDRTGGVDWCSAEDISRLLLGQDLRLVLLQGCPEAVSGTEPGFVYFSKSLTQRNIPAVVGMQYTISNEFATLFAEGFYQALLMGKNLDQAVQSGRKKIWYDGRGKKPQFGTPVLFTYNPDGIVGVEALTGRGPEQVRDPVPSRSLEGEIPQASRKQAVDMIRDALDILKGPAPDTVDCAIAEADLRAALRTVQDESPKAAKLVRAAQRFMKRGELQEAANMLDQALRRLEKPEMAELFIQAKEGKQHSRLEKRELAKLGTHEKEGKQRTRLEKRELAKLGTHEKEGKQRFFKSRID